MKNNPHQFISRITFAALRGGSGKTIASLGITRALSNRGKTIAVFKKGPDYIDAAWLARAAGRQCCNLDPYLMSREAIIRSFLRRSAASDLAVIEGNRGLFDGVDLKGGFSTAQLARIIGSPVVLVVDCTKVTRTMAAMVCGCRDFDQGVNIIGVILNRVAGGRHEKMLKDSIEMYARLPVLGVIPRMKKDPLPMRHLGLTPADEYEGPDAALDLLADIAEKNVDLERLLRLASRTGNSFPPVSENCPEPDETRPDRKITIGIVRDASFQFYYPENIEALQQQGARVVFLNAVSDTDVPDIHALYIGGGFPETQAQQLSENLPFKKKLRRLIEAGLPVYAECGGLMYLGRNLFWQDNAFQMLGILNWDFVLKKRPVGHGYSVLKFCRDSAFFKKGDIIRGHEFHYSQPVPAGRAGKGRFCCDVVRGHGFDGTAEGFSYKNVFGTYTHIHALGNEKWGRTIVDAAIRYKSKRIYG